MRHFECIYRRYLKSIISWFEVGKDFFCILFQFENDENERRRIHEERLKEKHRHLIQNLHNKQQATRNELLLVQVKIVLLFEIKKT